MPSALPDADTGLRAVGLDLFSKPHRGTGDSPGPGHLSPRPWSQDRVTDSSVVVPPQATEGTSAAAEAAVSPSPRDSHTTSPGLIVGA